VQQATGQIPEVPRTPREALLQTWNHLRVGYVLLIGLSIALSWLLTIILGGAGRVAPHWFYLPIMLAAYRFGRWATGATAVVATVVAGPLLPADVTHWVSQQTADWVSRGLFFILLGQAMVWLFIRLRQQQDLALAELTQRHVLEERLRNHAAHDSLTELRLAHQATHDSLTGIGNRPAAISAIEAALRRAARTGGTTAVLYVDLTEFKAVNDGHGHQVGDDVLCQVAARIVRGVRGGDFVARIGGDEFVVVAEGVAGVADATDLAQRIIESISQPIEVETQRISIGAAIGVALTLDGTEQPLTLLARSDAAMYRAKRHDSSSVEIFDADLQRQMVERADIESALAAALADPTGGGLLLHYQPVLEANSSALVGVEALIRWDRPGHGLLPPDGFIPIAEATALIIDLDCWVLGEATRQLVEWSAGGELAGVPVAVNISGRHLLSRTLPGHIRAALGRTGVDARLLGIEITETVLLTDLALAAAELEAVRALGVTVAIDDFGTGYTSLGHLQQLPIDTIKIDRSFVSQIGERRGSSLVRMVTDLGHAIDVNIVAEGVETSEEMTALQGIGADHVQGYLLSRALEPAALSTWARQRAASECQTHPPMTQPAQPALTDLHNGNVAIKCMLPGPRSPAQTTSIRAGM
jgi:diguanylate cyclase (GGDEF)-like protein